jgi:TRAP-type C4-dicarboxylate transport system substrate-binding protein
MKHAQLARRQRFAPARTLAFILMAALLGGAFAQEVTLRLHHFLSGTSPVHEGYLEPWAERIQEQSEGRIRIDIYPNMQLGGAPASLIDQVADGAVDLVWTLPGYTAGRFPVTEAFELPFMSGRAVASSQALCEFFPGNLEPEYSDVKVITLHTSGPGVFHVNGKGIQQLADMRGLQLRAPNSMTTEALALLGADPIGMPVPQVPESISRGVVDGALLPWEVTAPLRVAELVTSHTGFDADRGFYTSAFLLAMNPDSYNKLPDDLKAVIDANSISASCNESRIAGLNMDAADVPAVEMAHAEGNTFYLISAEETLQWQEALEPLIDKWVAKMNGGGLDGAALLAQARELVAKYEAIE